MDCKTDGAAVTVNTAGDALVMLSAVAVILLDPAATPVATPEVALIVAT